MCDSTLDSDIILRRLGLRDYAAVWSEMRAFTDQRTPNTADELWLVEHPPVYTQGQAGKPEHLLATSDIPVVASDRGGQITYHGPGQLVVYPLLDLKRRKMGVRELVTCLEDATIAFLASCSIPAKARPDAPGVYVEGRKIASLGLRVRRGCSYHGLAFNVTMDLQPFANINPCGYPGLQMTQLSDWLPDVTLNDISETFVGTLVETLNRSKRANKENDA